MNLYRQIVLGLVVCLSVAALTVPALTPAAAQNAQLNVIASFGILADVAANVAGDAADVSSLMAVGANPHAYSPSAQDVAQMSDADLVFVVGLNFEESLLPVVEEAAGDHMVIASACVPVRPIPDPNGNAATTPMSADLSGSPCADAIGTVESAFGFSVIAGHEGEFLGLESDGVCGDHDAAGAAPDNEANDHAPGSCDPHVWADPVNAALWALTIRDTLSARDPANAATYAANADAYLAQLVTLDADIQTAIAGVPADHRTIVTNHLALDYFAARYGLDVVGVVIPGGSTTAEPSVQDVLALIQTVQDYGVPAIFTDTTASDSTAQQIAGETGAKIVPLYTGSLSAPDGPAGTYLAYMRANATAVADALR